MADDCAGLLDAIDLPKVRVVGCSMGSTIAQQLAIRHPEKVKKLAITGANLWPDSTAIGAAEYLGGKSYYDTLGKMPQTPEIIHKRKLVKLDLFEPHITRAQLQQIQCPTLVIGGDHDIILPRHTLFISESIPGSYLWIVPNSSHSTLIDHKEKFNALVDEFFGNSLKR